jgi:hypothetical protein
MSNSATRARVYPRRRSASIHILVPPSLKQRFNAARGSETMTEAIETLIELAIAAQEQGGVLCIQTK